LSLVSAADCASAVFKKLDPEAQLPGGHDQQQAAAVHRLSLNFTMLSSLHPHQAYYSLLSSIKQLVESFDIRLKDAICARSALSTWQSHLLWGRPKICSA
jgi:hypothetical protein